MLAIHNYKNNRAKTTIAANAFAKLSKCQQFTTQTFIYIKFCLLQTLLQSYQNVSNSQLVQLSNKLAKCCKRFCKVIKMLAIHNSEGFHKFLQVAANAFAKLSKCQQFTTIIIYLLFFFRLQTLLQSYQNVSNSQPIWGRFITVLAANAFAKLSKCQQFTTILFVVNMRHWLQTLLQSYQNVSNSQPLYITFSLIISCKRFCKVIKMLAIHNDFEV